MAGVWFPLQQCAGCIGHAHCDSGRRVCLLFRDFVRAGQRPRSVAVAHVLLASTGAGVCRGRCSAFADDHLQSGPFTTFVASCIDDETLFGRPGIPLSSFPPGCKSGHGSGRDIPAAHDGRFETGCCKHGSRPLSIRFWFLAIGAGMALPLVLLTCVIVIPSTVRTDLALMAVAASLSLAGVWW